MRIFIKAALLVWVISIGCINSLFAQVFPLTMPETEKDWSGPQSITLKTSNGESQNVQVRTKLVKHFGTTGVMEVEITNFGPKTINGYVGLIKGTENINQAKSIAANNSAKISRLETNTWIKFQLEIRECLPKDRKGMNDLQKCVACNPYIGFADVKLN